MKRTRMLSFGISLCAVVLLLAACGAPYTLVESSMHSLSPQRSQIAVAVWQDGDYDSDPSELQAYLTVALVNKGFKARAFNLEMLFGRSYLKRLMTGDLYAPTDGMVAGMKKGGMIEGDAAALEDFIPRTEKLDEVARYKTMEKLAKDLPGDWDYNYLMVVHQFDTWSFASYVIDIESKDVVNMVVLSGSRDGFINALNQPKIGKVGSDAQDGDVSRLHWLRLAGYLVDRL